MNKSIPLAVIAVFVFAACSENEKLDPIAPLENVPPAPWNPAGPEQPAPAVRGYPTGEIPEDPHLADGYLVYRTACMGCHDSGATNAPVITNTTYWRKRIEQGRQTLYRNSIEGHTGERGFMPPKGGSPGSWTDGQVRAAVDYMIFIVEGQEQKGGS